jgi:hypothetical protein
MELVAYPGADNVVALPCDLSCVHVSVVVGASCPARASNRLHVILPPAPHAYSVSVGNRAVDWIVSLDAGHGNLMLPPGEFVALDWGECGWQVRPAPGPGPDPDPAPVCFEKQVYIKPGKKYALTIPADSSCMNAYVHADQQASASAHGGLELGLPAAPHDFYRLKVWNQADGWNLWLKFGQQQPLLVPFPQVARLTWDPTNLVWDVDWPVDPIPGPDPSPGCPPVWVPAHTGGEYVELPDCPCDSVRSIYVVDEAEGHGSMQLAVASPPPGLPLFVWILNRSCGWNVNTVLEGLESKKLKPRTGALFYWLEGAWHYGHSKQLGAC